MPSYDNYYDPPHASRTRAEEYLDRASRGRGGGNTYQSYRDRDPDFGTSQQSRHRYQRTPAPYYAMTSEDEEDVPPRAPSPPHHQRRASTREHSYQPAEPSRRHHSSSTRSSNTRSSNTRSSNTHSSSSFRGVIAPNGPNGPVRHGYVRQAFAQLFNSPSTRSHHGSIRNTRDASPPPAPRSSRHAREVSPPPARHSSRRVRDVSPPPAPRSSRQRLFPPQEYSDPDSDSSSEYEYIYIGNIYDGIHGMGGHYGGGRAMDRY